MKLLFEKSRPGARAIGFPPSWGKASLEQCIPAKLRRRDNPLPELSETEIVRHYTALSKRNYGVEDGFYPLGSCTMKYNPKINEDTAALPGFSGLHPLQPEEHAQGALRLLHELEQGLCALTGMDRFTFQPAAGAHGELTGILIMKAFFQDRGEPRARVLVPDSSHGTNPASAALGGFRVEEVPSDRRGGVDLGAFKNALAEDVAGLMLTNPNTLGVHDENIATLTRLVHEHGGLCYYDGANMNANLGYARPREMGFDIVHLNLHKTFSTPHGGGGPGSGPVGVTRALEPFLPRPLVTHKNGRYAWDWSGQKSIGKLSTFYGNFAVAVRAYTYYRCNGAEGLKKASEHAVLNANYLMHLLKKHYTLPFDRACKHEFVLSDEGLENGVTAMDIAKRILDYGFHAPTVYFPLIVHGALMIEPTETETKDTLDAFADAMARIRQEIRNAPEKLKNAPQNTPVARLDAVQAARRPVLRYTPPKEKPAD